MVGLRSEISLGMGIGNEGIVVSILEPRGHSRATCEQRARGGKAASHVHVTEKNTPEGGNCHCRESSEAGVCLPCSEQRGELDERSRWGEHWRRGQGEWGELCRAL